MPKIVDHDQRRAEIGTAVHRILLRDGLAGATVRAVVAESGMSSGAIRHYFPTQDELLRFAAQGITERVENRIRVAFQRPHRTPRARVLDVLEQLLPMDRERLMELEAFNALAARDPAWGQTSWLGVRITARTCALLLAGQCLTVIDDRPLRSARTERLAELLQLIVDGLAAQQIFYGITPDATRLRSALARAVDDAARLSGRNRGRASAIAPNQAPGGSAGQGPRREPAAGPHPAGDHLDQNLPRRPTEPSSRLPGRGGSA